MWIIVSTAAFCADDVTQIDGHPSRDIESRMFRGSNDPYIGTSTSNFQFYEKGKIKDYITRARAVHARK